MLEQSSEEFRESVCQGLNTTLAQMEGQVNDLKEWIKTQPHLPQCATNTMLTSYLVACKTRMEVAKRKIDNYYSAKGKLPDYFGDRDPSNERFLEVSRELRFFLVPKMTPDGCRLAIMNFATGDVKKFDTSLYINRMMAQEDVGTHREAFNKGRYLIFDGANFTMAHVLRISPTNMKHLMHFTQDVLPVRMKGVIFINAPTVLDILLNFIRPFTKAKLLRRFHIHTEGCEILEKYFPKAILPRDYGGEEDTSEHLNDAWIECLQQNRDWLINEGSLKSDEGKRVKVKSEQKQTGSQELVGSFKNLSID